MVVPGPRGVIYARDGTTVLVGNRPRFSVVLYLDELKSEFLREARTIKSNYRKSGLTEAALRDMPFGRIAVVADGPIAIPPNMDEAATEQHRQMIEARLNAATVRAYAIADGKEQRP